MKKTAVIFILTFFTFLITNFSFAEISDVASTDTTNNAASAHTLKDGLKRGIVNVTMAAVEVPRCAVYYAQEFPVIGFISGLVHGGGLTLSRIVGGAIDLVSLGAFQPGYTFYDLIEVPYNPFDAPWTYKEN